MKKVLCFLLGILMLSTVGIPAFAADGTVLSIHKNNISHAVSPTLYGVFLEDISFAGDGGLVANLINNGSFEDGDKPENAWAFDNLGAVLSQEDAMNSANPNYETLTVDGKGTLENIGFTELFDYKTHDYNEKSAHTPDMGFQENVKYTFSCYVKNIDFDGTVGVYLNSKSNKNNIVQMATNGIGNTQWTKLTATLTSKATEDGSLVILFEGKGSLKFDFASLVPHSSYGYGSDEWKYVSLRSDMVEALKNLNPAFIRFPGGCLAEGTALDKMYSWKYTIGAPEQRRQLINMWADANNGKYNVNTNALGYHEYFQLCEDLGAKAVPVVHAGITCQARNGYQDIMLAYQKMKMSDEAWRSFLITERGYDENDEEGIASFTAYIDGFGITSEKAYQKKLDEIALRPGTDAFRNYVQDVLDLVEYATADATTSYWGALRAANGHAAPFEMSYLAIGNENWGDVYFRNFKAIYKAVHKAYPKLKIIPSAGAAAEGSDFDASQQTIRQHYASLTADEHYYVSDNWLLENLNRYDSYDRDGARVMVGEYGTFSEGYGTMITKTNMRTATAVGAYMTGLERNSDIVTMASMAPTFAKVNADSWNQNLIWFDSQSLALSADYYTQMLFANNLGTKYAEAEMTETEDLYQSVTVDEGKQLLFVKLVNTGDSNTVEIRTDGFDIGAVSMQSMAHKYRSASNEIGKQRVAPQQTDVKAEKNSVRVKLEANSVNVVRIAYGSNSGNNFYLLPDTMNLETKAYVPPVAIVAVIVISVCLFGGMAVGYIIYAKVLAKRRKNK